MRMVREKLMFLPVPGVLFLVVYVIVYKAVLQGYLRGRIVE
jgi:hypothetical protein